MVESEIVAPPSPSDEMLAIAPVLALDEGALGDCAWFCLSVHGSYKSTPSVIRT